MTARWWHWITGAWLAASVLGACSAPAAAPPARPTAAPPTAASAPAPAAGAAAAAPAAPAAAAAAPASAVRPLDPPVPVRVGVLFIFVDAGLLIAYEKGYFREEGLDVSFELFRSSAEQFPPLATGDLQFGTGALDPSLFNGIARDISVRIVADKSRNSPTHGVGAIVARRELYDSGALDSPAKLRGRTMALSTLSGIPQRYVQLALDRVGVNKDELTLTQLPFPDMPAALANGNIDAAWMNEPFLAVSEERGYARRLVSAAQLDPNLVTNILTISDRFAQAQPEAARRFVTAHLRAQRDYHRAFVLNEDPALRQEIVGILIQHTAVKDPALYDRMDFHAVDPNGFVDPAVIGNVQDYFANEGLVRERVDPSRVVDRQYIEYALQRLGRLPDPWR